MRIIPILIMVLALIVATLSVAFAGEAHAFEEGELVSGFRLNKIVTDSVRPGTFYAFAHEQSGAQLIWWDDGRTNRTFTVGFHTVTDDNMGLPHVFEHAACSGSEKYPDSKLIISLMSGAYVTYSNALTSTLFTAYQTASLSEEQLLQNVDIVLNGVYHPLVLSDERAMMREAFRYELADADTDITTGGTVYTEMQGTSSQVTELNRELLRTFFPGSYTASVTGGLPSDIPSMTHDDLKEFHSTFYTPSNSLMILTGDMDIRPILEQIDREQLAGQTPRTVDFTDGYTPATTSSRHVLEYPLAEDAEANYIAIEGMPVEKLGAKDAARMTLWLQALCCDTGELNRLALERFPLYSIGGNIIDGGYPCSVIYFEADNIDEADEDAVFALCDEAVERQLEAGTDEMTMRALRSGYMANIDSANDAADAGINLSVSLIRAWANDGDPFGYDALEHYIISDDFEEDLKTDAFTETARRVMGQRNVRLRVATRGVPGMADPEAGARAERLREMKAAMTPEEIDALVARTADFAAWTAANEKVSLLNEVNVVTVDTLPEELMRYTARDETIAGLRVVSCDSGLELADVTIYFDATGIAPEELEDYYIYRNMLGEVSTAHYDRRELSARAGVYAVGLAFSSEVLKCPDGSTKPCMAVNFRSAPEDIEEAFRLVEEILFESDFASDPENVRNGFENSYRMNKLLAVSRIPESLVMDELLGRLLPERAYNAVASNELMLDSGHALAEADAAVYAETVKRAEAIGRKLLNRRGMFLTVAGSDAAVESATACALRMRERMADAEIIPADCSALYPAQEHVAIIGDTDVAFNTIAIAVKDLSMDFDGKMLAMAKLLRERVLFPELRYKYNSYSAIMQASKDYLLAMAYRDPMTANTFDVVFPRMGELLRAQQLTQIELDGFIMSAYSGLAMPQSRSDGADTAIKDVLSGEDSYARRMGYLRDLKAMTVEDVKTYSHAFDELAEKGLRGTVTNKKDYEENSGLFDTVNTWFAG